MAEFFGDLFDFDGDEISSPQETIAGLSFLEALELDALPDLEELDEEERREALEEAGLDDSDWT